ncbi:MAG: phosphate/phosphite/phosphonate ABC transporter substrate-binding protein, partial [Candidatus Latescibacterota bacterium]
FGVVSRYNPVVMYESYQPLMDYLTETTPYRFELKLGKNYDEDVRFLEQGLTQVALLGVVTYLEAHARFGAMPILKTLNQNGEPFYHGVVVVREDSDIQTLADLKGRSFCFAAVHSTSSNLFGRYSLMEAGVRIQDLSTYIHLKHHDQVAKAVLTGQYDAVAIKDIVARRYASQGLRLLQVSNSIPSIPIVVRQDAPIDLVTHVKQALLKFRTYVVENDTELWDEEFRYGFVEASDKDYTFIRKMLNTIPGRCGDSCHPSLAF